VRERYFHGVTGGTLSVAGGISTVLKSAGLHRSDCKDRCVEDVEALGRGSEFQSGDFSRNITGAPPLAVKLPRWHQVEQGVPGA